MIVNVKDLVSYAIKKQFKISHVPCEVMVFEKDEIPAEIKSKIEDQYDDKFLDDSDKVIFFKGPIDKDMVQKLFKAVDKALGEDSNKLVVGDFKLLKVADSDDGFTIDDEDEETPESDGTVDDGEPDEKPVPTSDDEVTDDEVNAVLDADEANEKAAGDADDVNTEPEDDAEMADAENAEDGKAKNESMKKKALKKEKKLSEAGLSLDDILKKGNQHAEKRNAAIAADDAKKKAIKVKQIWVKDFIIDDNDDNRSVANVQITYADGEVRDTTLSMSTTGSGDTFSRPAQTHGYFIQGEHFKQGDELYREFKHNLLKGQGKTPQCLPKGEQIQDADVRLSMLKFGFPADVTWVYGKDKMSTPWYAFDYRTQPAPEAADYLKKSERKSWVELERAGRSRPLYSRGSTKIYRIHEDEEENAEGGNEGTAKANVTADEENTEEVPTRYVMLKVSMKG